jgi:hypothetical protein
MTNELTEHEDSIRVSRFSFCDRFEATEDLVFAYPSGEFDAEPQAVANTLQQGMDYLKDLTDLNPKQVLGSRVVVGYRHPSQPGGTGRQSTWSGRDGNRVFLSWQYLDYENEPMHICGHELVHPFYRVSPLHDKNEGWGEGFCDFLRAPVINFIGLEEESDIWWAEMIRAAPERENKPGTHQNPAGQFVLMLAADHGSANEADQIASMLINRQDYIKEFVMRLFQDFADRRLREVLTPTDDMIRQYGYDKL